MTATDTHRAIDAVWRIESAKLLDQDRMKWDLLLIRRGFAAIARANAIGRPLGFYALQAGIAACHARARVAADTDWTQIAMLYDALARVVPSPLIELNRAVAVGMAHSAAEGLTIVEALADEPSLQSYYVLPMVRGDVLEKLGRRDEARVAFERAASLTRNAREREVLLKRAAACV